MAYLKRAALAAFAAAALAGTSFAATPALAAPAKAARTSVKAVEPRITSDVDAKKIEWVRDGQPQACPTGSICLSVWDPTHSPAMWKVYTLNVCARYNFHDWIGEGYINDQQTGGVFSDFYNSAGKLIFRKTPGDQVKENWTPVDYVVTC
ncbi:hypothetical protein ACFXJ6_34340 [Streptomyces sp. NPDC059218]|uniref:hypothetical protein n=1 Tax=unclassified Streptomyces TaxID=2593676 RepID=UPI0036C87E42